MAEQGRAGAIQFPDGAVAGHGEITCRRKVVEVRVALQILVRSGARLLQFVVLQFQLDLVDVQFVDQPQAVSFGERSTGPGLLRWHARFRAATQLSGGGQRAAAESRPPVSNLLGGLDPLQFRLGGAQSRHEIAARKLGIISHGKVILVADSG